MNDIRELGSRWAIKIRHQAIEIVYEAILGAYERADKEASFYRASPIQPTTLESRAPSGLPKPTAHDVADSIAAEQPDYGVAKSWWLSIEKREYLAEGIRAALEIYSVKGEALNALWSHTLAADAIIYELNKPKPVYVLFNAAGYGHEWKFYSIFTSPDVGMEYVTKSFPSSSYTWLAPKPNDVVQIWEAHGFDWWRIQEFYPKSG